MNSAGLGGVANHSRVYFETADVTNLCENGCSDPAGSGRKAASKQTKKKGAALVYNPNKKGQAAVTVARMSTQLQQVVRERKRSKTQREKLWAFCDDPESGPLATVFAKVIFALIIISCTSLILGEESIDGADATFDAIEVMCISCFTVELVLRTVSAPNYKKYFKSFYTWVDVVAIFPFYAEMLFADNTRWLGVVRILRLVRIVRLFKMSRYSISIRVMLAALSQSRRALSMLVVLAFVAGIVFTSGVYFVEETVNNCLEVNDDGTCAVQNPFSSIPAGMWWCVVTLAAVGYGDVVPRTPVGKIFGAFCCVSGILIMALPITVVGTNFARVLRETTREQIMHLIATIDKDDDGNVTEDELIIMLDNFKKLGFFVSAGHEYVARELMMKYDVDGTGSLDAEQLLALQADLEVKTMDMLTADVDTYSLDTRGAKNNEEEFGQLLKSNLLVMERHLQHDISNAMHALVDLNNELAAMGGGSEFQSPILQLPHSPVRGTFNRRNSDMLEAPDGQVSYARAE